MSRQRNDFSLLLGPAALLLTSGLASAQISTQQLTKISNGNGGLVATLDGFDRFGCSVAGLSDLDGNGIGDLAVGACGDDDGQATSPFSGLGAVHLLRLDADGMVLAESKISATSGGLTGPLGAGDEFGLGLASVGDLDGNGVDDLAVGAPGDDDAGLDAGAVYVLLLDASGNVIGESKLGAGGLTTAPLAGDAFGSGLGLLGDLDGDGSPTLAIGAPGADGDGFNRGAVWLVELSATGGVLSESVLDDGVASLGLLDGDGFGSAVSGLGDFDGDGSDDVAIGAPGSDDGGANRGAVHLVRLDNTGAALGSSRISATSGSFPLPLDNGDGLGSSLAGGLLDNDGTPDLYVGAFLDDDGGADRGAMYILFLDSAGSVTGGGKLSSGTGGFDSSTLDDGDTLAGALAIVDDVDGNGFADVVLGASFDDDGGSGAGAVWTAFYSPFFPARITPVNGTGCNPELLTISGAPILGDPLNMGIDVTGWDGSVLSIGFGGLFTFPCLAGPVLFGELLILSPTLAPLVQVGAGSYALTLPLNPALLGQSIQMQGIVFRIGAPNNLQFTNAFDLLLGSF